MASQMVLGVDCGGTHTDAALLEIDAATRQAHLLAAAKTVTNHSNLTESIQGAVSSLHMDKTALAAIASVTLGTTLAINAIVQHKTDQVGLALAAGPGLDSAHFGIGSHICIVPGGLDHRGVEVTPLYTEELADMAVKWAQAGIGAVACVGKFSPRNPLHEQKMAAAVKKAVDLPVVQGHELSGSLNFPRRIATAYYSAAVRRLHHLFLADVEKAFGNMGINAPLRLLKADGGATPFNVARNEPAQSILSGPAASVMGCMAVWPDADSGCALLLDMGGTTTDLALLLHGSPVVDRNGMAINGRRTLVRSLASISIGIGGDSLLNIQQNEPRITVGPQRKGPAMAFGGQEPTLLDAVNYLDRDKNSENRGKIEASVAGIAQLAATTGIDSGEICEAAEKYAFAKIMKATYDLVEGVNSRPIYTLAALKAARQARPERACIIGGPAHIMRARCQNALGMPVAISPWADVVNAIGAALTLPTAQVEIYADTGKGRLTAPALDYMTQIPASMTLEEAKEIAARLLKEKLASEGIKDAAIQIAEADLFATLDDYGKGARDMRVICQATPGILAKMRPLDGNESNFV